MTTHTLVSTLPFGIERGDYETPTSLSAPGAQSWRTQIDTENVVGSENGETTSEMEWSSVKRSEDCWGPSADSGTRWNWVSPSGSTLYFEAKHTLQSVHTKSRSHQQSDRLTLTNTCEMSRTHSTTAWTRCVNGQFAVISSGSLGGWRRPPSKKTLALASARRIVFVPAFSVSAARLSHERGHAERETRTNSRVISSMPDESRRESKLNHPPTGGEEDEEVEDEGRVPDRSCCIREASRERRPIAINRLASVLELAASRTRPILASSTSCKLHTTDTNVSCHDALATFTILIAREDVHVPAAIRSGRQHSMRTA